METPSKKTKMACKAGKDACFNSVKSKKSLKRHVQCQLPYCQRSSPKLLDDNSMDTSAGPVARAGLDFVDHDPEAWYDYHQTKEDMDRTVYSTAPKLEEGAYPLNSEKRRIFDIIVQFFAYWSDEVVETRAIDTVTQLLIKHSRSVQRNESNYIEITMSALNILHRLDQLHLQTLLELINDFIVNVRRKKADRLFDWDCLIICFTVAHELLMTYPHLYNDLVDMLCEVFRSAGDDLDEQGGWNDFMSYSQQFIM